MTITYDREAKAVYLKLKDTKICKSVEFAPEIFVDLDYANDIVGVEMLHPGTLKIVRRIAKEYHEPALNKINKDIFPQEFNRLEKHAGNYVH